ncbi:sugar ABC transporter permease [Aureimonas ureilytica]|uniref:Sugar ABC transporter permease n=2 Tax=Aurantimonadaceae TaxID=255475 RepID=A0A175RSZ0_9HYPH|nr:sugar ABC transporter permease [Aureimonas ureilytica]
MTAMRIKNLVINLALGAGGLVMLLPFAWMLSLSLKPENEIYTPDIAFLPREWDFANYVEAWTVGYAGTFVINGVIVTLGILVLQYLTIIPAAYVLARKNFRIRGLIMSTVLAVLLIPPQVTAIPVYMMLAEARLLDTYAALIIPFASSAFGIFLLRQSFRTVPQELIDAARMDGASEAYTLWFVVVPQVLPALAAFGIFSVVTHWNDFFWPLLVVTSIERATPPLGISIFASNEGGNEVGPMMATATLVVMPLVIAFLIARRRFVEGVTLSGLKG